MRPAGQRRFISVGIKMGVATLVVLGLVTAAVELGLSAFLRGEMIADKEQGARMANDLFLRFAATPVVFDDATGIHDTVAQLGQEPDVLGVELWRAGGGKLAGSLASWFRDGVRGVPGAWVERATVERQPDRLVVRDAIRDPDHRVIAVAAVQYSLARENAAYQKLRRRTPLYAAGVVAVLALLLRWVLRRTVIRPLGRLLGRVRQVEAGERVALDSGTAADEVGRLAEAFGRMAEAVDRRERDIARRNHDMKLVLENVEQGFLVIDRSGAMTPERSAIVARWFGAAAPDQTIADYLRAVDPGAAAMLELGLEAIRDGFMPLALCIEQLPRRLGLGDRSLRCDYRPITSGETLDQLVLVISDVTAEVERARAEVEQRDLMAGASRLLVDRAGMLDFLDEAGALVARVVDATESGALEQVMRDVHTLKGICALFGLNGIVERCHGLESRMADTGALPPASDRGGLGRQWTALASGLRAFAGSERNVVRLSDGEYRRFQQVLKSRASHTELIQRISHWIDDPVLPNLERLADHATKLAARLGKCNVAVELAGGDLRLPHEPWHELWACLTHVVRNAVDHGLETEAERVAAGKPPAARISLAVTEDPAGVTVSVADDGRGIDWEAIRRKAGSLGLPCGAHDELVAALFADGVTTRASATATSGRGVGLAAVHQAVRTLRGEIRVTSEPGRGTRIELVIPRAPDSALRAS